eukprot:g5100.t1
MSINKLLNLATSMKNWALNSPSIVPTSAIANNNTNDDVSENVVARELPPLSPSPMDQCGPSGLCIRETFCKADVEYYSQNQSEEYDFCLRGTLPPLIFIDVLNQLGFAMNDPLVLLAAHALDSSIDRLIRYESFVVELIKATRNSITAKPVNLSNTRVTTPRCYSKPTLHPPCLSSSSPSKKRAALPLILEKKPSLSSSPSKKLSIPSFVPSKQIANKRPLMYHSFQLPVSPQAPLHHPSNKENNKKEKVLCSELVIPVADGKRKIDPVKHNVEITQREKCLLRKDEKVLQQSLPRFEKKMQTSLEKLQMEITVANLFHEKEIADAIRRKKIEHGIHQENIKQLYVAKKKVALDEIEAEHKEQQNCFSEVHYVEKLAEAVSVLDEKFSEETERLKLIHIAEIKKIKEQEFLKKQEIHLQLQREGEIMKNVLEEEENVHHQLLDLKRKIEEENNEREKIILKREHDQAQAILNETETKKNTDQIEESSGLKFQLRGEIEDFKSEIAILSQTIIKTEERAALCNENSEKSMQKLQQKMNLLRDENTIDRVNCLEKRLHELQADLDKERNAYASALQRQDEYPVMVKNKGKEKVGRKEIVINNHIGKPLRADSIGKKQEKSKGIFQKSLSFSHAQSSMLDQLENLTTKLEDATSKSRTPRTPKSTFWNEEKEEWIQMEGGDSKYDERKEESVEEIGKLWSDERQDWIVDEKKKKLKLEGIGRLIALFPNPSSFFDLVCEAERETETIMSCEREKDRAEVAALSSMGIDDDW